MCLFDCWAACRRGSVSGCSLWSVVVFGAWLGDGFGGSPLGWWLTLAFTLGLTLAGSWPFFGDTVVIIGDTPSRSEPHTQTS